MKSTINDLDTIASRKSYFVLLDFFRDESCIRYCLSIDLDFPRAIISAKSL